MTALSCTEAPAPIGSRAVAAQDGAEPDARAVADVDVADQDRGGRDQTSSPIVGRTPSDHGQRMPVNSGAALARGGQALAVVVGLQQRGLREALGERGARVDVGREQQPLGGGEGQRRAEHRLHARACARAASSSTTSVSRPSRERAGGVEVVAAEQHLLGAREAEQLDEPGEPAVGRHEPSRPSRKRMRARGEPTRQSQASASARPAPVTTPSIAATTGFSSRSTASTSSVRRCATWR